PDGTDSRRRRTLSSDDPLPAPTRRSVCAPAMVAHSVYRMPLACHCPTEKKRGLARVVCTPNPSLSPGPGKMCSRRWGTCSVPQAGNGQPLHRWDRIRQEETVAPEEEPDSHAGDRPDEFLEGHRAYLDLLVRIRLPPWLRQRLDPCEVVNQTVVNALLH